MKPHLHMDSLVSCSGNCLATCERVLSGAKRCARKAFALLIVLSLVFSLPVSAGVLDTFQCVVNLQPDTFAIMDDPMNPYYQYGFASVPASFTYSFAENTNVYSWEWSKATALRTFEELITESDKKIEFIVNVGDGSSDLSVTLERCSFDFLMRLYDGSAVSNFYYGFYGTSKLISDSGEIVYQFEEDLYDTFPVYSDLTFTCSQYFSIEFLTTSDWNDYLGDYYDAIDQVLNSELEFYIEDNAVSLDSISIQISDLKESVDNIGSSVTDIGNDVGSIKTTVENIQDGVVEINGIVTDMKEQLEEPDSPIWSAAGEKIADTIKEVFVPSEEEMQAEKQELENLLDDKLGDAKVLFDQGETLVTDIRGIIGNMSSDASNSVHFPGISLPMNGETYVIVPEQDVKLNNRAFLIFQNALGMGITVLCWWSILHICEDLLYCLISGVSYWGFIRSRHDQ